MPKTAGIVLVGNEILSGKIADANAAHLCRELRALAEIDCLGTGRPYVSQHAGRWLTCCCPVHLTLR